MATTLSSTTVTFGDGTQQTIKNPYYLSRTVISSFPYAITGLSTGSSPNRAQKVNIAVTFQLSGTDTINLNLGTSAGTYYGTNHWSFVGETGASSFGGTASTSGTAFRITRTGASTYNYVGNIEITRYSSSTNVYHVRWNFGSSSGTYRTAFGNGWVMPGGVVDRVTFSVSGTNTPTIGVAWINPH